MEKLEEIRAVLWKAMNTYKPHSQTIAAVHSVSRSPTSLNTRELRTVTMKLLEIVSDQEPVLRNYLRMVKERVLSVTQHILLHSNSSSSNAKEQSNEGGG